MEQPHQEPHPNGDGHQGQPCYNQLNSIHFYVLLSLAIISLFIAPAFEALLWFSFVESGDIVNLFLVTSS